MATTASARLPAYRRWSLLAAALALTCWWTAASNADEPIDYLKQIKPVFQERCYACHGALKQKAGLRLDAAALAIKGGKGGPVIKPGDVAGSALLERIAAGDDQERMPPEGERLTAGQIAAIRAWIAQGAKAPADEQPERDPRDHWAFQPPVRPVVPKVADAAWAANPIDAFIAASHEQRGLTRQPPADKRLWLRRVTIDLTGLPPTLEEMEAFVKECEEEGTKARRHEGIEAQRHEGKEARRHEGIEGLPITNQQSAISNQQSPYDKVIDRLLASPHYGERWGRHWMDIWRYSDWWGLGAEVRSSQKHIWHWRDWIVESLNADKGYDQMLREMLAADELYPNDMDKLRAGGFLARQYFKFNRTSWLDETIEHTAKSMLGLTINCAKCHDHKYDPVSQVEYYQLRAFFEPYQVRTDFVAGELDPEKDGIPRAFDCNLAAMTHLHIRGDDRNPDKSRVIAPAAPAFLSCGEMKIAPVRLPVEAQQPGLRPWVVDAHLKLAEQRIADATKAVAAAKVKLAESEAAAKVAATTPEPSGAGSDKPGPAKPKDGPLSVQEAKLALTAAEKSLAAAAAQPPSIRARAAADRARLEQPAPDNLKALLSEAVRGERIATAAKADEDAARAEFDLLRAAPPQKADAQKKLAAAMAALEKARKAIDAPGETYTSLVGALKTVESNLESEDSRRKPFPATSTGRRTALAAWITDAKNPLTARVAVNHIWARHMGRPLVATVFDFGRKGATPTHPQLLDWLAVELIEHDWSMKHIHRLIVTSQTYRLSSSNLNAPPAALATDADNHYYWRMNPTRMEAQAVRDSLLHLAGELDLKRGGPSIPVKDEASRRRSLYFVHSHIERQKFLATFDDASVFDCYRRSESIVPQQALALENSTLAVSMAQKIARRIADTKPADDRRFIRAAFVTVLCAEPTEAELAVMLDALAQLTDAAKRSNRPDPAMHARTSLVHALLNHNDFVTIR